MNLTYETLPDDKIDRCRELCNELMAFQKKQASIKPELFDNMNFETRLIPSIRSALHNYTVVVKDDDQLVGYVYSSISPKETYSNEFAAFFDLHSVNRKNVGCLSQFYIKALFLNFAAHDPIFASNKSAARQEL